MADFFELQDKARAKTRTLVIYFLVAVTLIVIAVNAAVWFAANIGGFVEMPIIEWVKHPYSWITSASILALIFITSAIQSAKLSGGGVAVAKMVGARRILQGTKTTLERRLLNVTEEMSIASGMPMPKVFVMDNEMGINAFVAGLQPSETVLVVTQGTLEKLSRDELQGVVGHEFSHIFNSDMSINVRLMGILSGILVIGQLGYILMRVMGSSRRGVRLSRSSGNSSNSGANAVALIAILGVALFAIGYIGLFFGRLIKASISRQREYLADASSVQFTRDADGISQALAHIRIDSNRGLLQNSHAEDMSHMCFEAPVKLSLQGWLATHPPLDQRILALNPNFSFSDYKPSKPKKKKPTTKEKDKPDSKHAFPDILGFAATTAQTNSNFTTKNTTPSSTKFVDSIGKPSSTSLINAEKILKQIPSEILQQSNSDTIKAQLLAYILLIHAEPEDKEAINRTLKTHIPATYFDLFLEWQQKLLPLSGWIRLPLLNHVIPVLQQCNIQQLDSFFNSMLKIIKNNKHINLSEYILYALLKLRLHERKKQTIIPSLVEVKPELSFVFSLVIQSAYSDPVEAKELYIKTMKGFAIGLFPEISQQNFNAVTAHNALLQLSRLSPFLKRSVVAALGDCVIDDKIIQVNEYELVRAICDYLDCPLPPMEFSDK